MLQQIRSANPDRDRSRGVEIEVLLQGAEKLCAAYDTPGVLDRIATLRQKYDKISRSLQSYEDQISQQQASMNTFGTNIARDEADVDASENGRIAQNEQDPAAEEAVIKELETKKRALEAMVAGMERDLGGLMR